jgi:hypothetical protein
MGEGEDAATMAARIRSKPALDERDSNRLAALEKRRASDCRELRRCSQHLRDYAKANGIGPLDLDSVCPGRADRIDCMIAEGSSVWTHFKMAGTQTGMFLGCPPTGRRVEMTAVRIQTFSGGACTDVWCFGDELGLLQQVDAVHLLLP